MLSHSLSYMPLGEVQSLSATSTTTSITLMWLPPNTNNAEDPTLSYTVIIGSGTLLTSATNIILMELEPGTEYMIIVSAKNEAGSGPETTIFVMTEPNGMAACALLPMCHRYHLLYTDILTLSPFILPSYHTHTMHTHTHTHTHTHIHTNTICSMSNGLLWGDD